MAVFDWILCAFSPFGRIANKLRKKNTRNRSSSASRRRTDSANHSLQNQHPSSIDEIDDTERCNVSSLTTGSAELREDTPVADDLLHEVEARVRALEGLLRSFSPGRLETDHSHHRSHRRRKDRTLTSSCSSPMLEKKKRSKSESRSRASPSHSTSPEAGDISDELKPASSNPLSLSENRTESRNSPVYRVRYANSSPQWSHARPIPLDDVQWVTNAPLHVNTNVESFSNGGGSVAFSSSAPRLPWPSVGTDHIHENSESVRLAGEKHFEVGEWVDPPLASVGHVAPSRLVGRSRVRMFSSHISHFSNCPCCPVLF